MKFLHFIALATIASSPSTVAKTIGGDETREEIRNDPILKECKNQCRFMSAGYRRCLDKCIEKKKK